MVPTITCDNVKKIITLFKKVFALSILGAFSLVSGYSHHEKGGEPGASTTDLKNSMFTLDFFKTKMVGASHPSSSDNSDCKGCDTGPGSADGGTGCGCDLCFRKGTMILMADESEKPIEIIEVGDRVMSFTEGGDLVPGVVTQLFHHEEPAALIQVNEVTTTMKHRFLTASGAFKAVEDLLTDDQLVNQAGESVPYTIKTLDVKEKVYNFETTPHHTYIAGGYRVHNIK